MTDQLLSLQIPILMPITTASNEDIAIFEIPLGRTQIQKRGLTAIKGVGVSVSGDRLVSGRFQLQVNGQTYIDTILRKGLHSFGCNKMLANQYPLPEITINSSLGSDNTLGLDGEIIASFLPLKVESDGSGVIGYAFIDSTRPLSVPTFFSNAILLVFASSLDKGDSIDIAIQAAVDVAMIDMLDFQSRGNLIEIESEAASLRAFLGAINIAISPKSTLDNDNVSILLHLISY